MLLSADDGVLAVVALPFVPNVIPLLLASLLLASCCGYAYVPAFFLAFMLLLAFLLLPVPSLDGVFAGVPANF